MMNEAVKVVVKVESGEKFAKVVTVRSDGSWIEVNRAVSRIVGKEFTNHKVEEFWWNYV